MAMRKRAETTFASALSLALDNTEVNYYRTDYGSQLRDGAAMLALAAETKPMPAAVPAMIRFVAAARAKVSYTSTQDEAWMLLAARAIKEGNQAISLTSTARRISVRTPTRVTGDELLNQPITVANPEPGSAGGRRHHGRRACRSPCRPAAMASRSSAPTTSSTAARRT